MDSSKYLFLITGAAGSGKSTLATKIQNLSKTYLDRPVMDICEADDFWYILGKGEYAFDPKMLWRAHRWCQGEAENHMQKGESIIVSNTSLTPKDRKPYFDLADKHGYDVVFIHQTGKFQNLHKVPDDAVERMRSRYVPPTDWEVERILSFYEMEEGLATLLEDVGVKYEY